MLSVSSCVLEGEEKVVLFLGCYTRLMNISFSLPHLIRFCGGLRTGETHCTDGASVVYLPRT